MYHTFSFYQIRIHFAGTETATLWRGFISGAIQSGERAADEILSVLDEHYVITDEVDWIDILVPGCMTEQRNTYYVLNGVIALSLAVVVGATCYVVYKCKK